MTYRPPCAKPPRMPSRDGKPALTVLRLPSLTSARKLRKSRRLSNDELAALLPDVSDKPSNAARASARSWVVSAPSDRESACSLSPSSRSCRLRKPSVTVWAYASAPLQDGTVVHAVHEESVVQTGLSPYSHGVNWLAVIRQLASRCKGLSARFTCERLWGTNAFPNCRQAAGINQEAADGAVFRCRKIKQALCPSLHCRLKGVFQRREGVAAMFQRGGCHS